MSPSCRSSRAALAPWRALAGCKPEAGAPTAEWLRRLAAFLGPAWVWSLAEGAWRGGDPPFTAEELRDSALHNRLRRARQTACLETIAGAGVPLVALKGYVLAQQVYPRADLREPGAVPDQPLARERIGADQEQRSIEKHRVTAQCLGKSAALDRAR